MRTRHTAKAGRRPSSHHTPAHDTLEVRTLLSVDVHFARNLPESAAPSKGPVLIDILSDGQLDATSLRPRSLNITTHQGRVLSPSSAWLADRDGDGDRDLVLSLPRTQLNGVSGPVSIRVASPTQEIGVDAVPGREGALTSGFSLQANPSDSRGALTSASGFISNQYLVVFKDGMEPTRTSTVIDRMAGATGATVLDTYQNSLQGFAANLGPRAARVLAKDPRVAFVEQDQIVSVDTTQTSPPWGLDRIDQVSRPLDGKYNYTRNGSGVTAYVIDTGVRVTHNEFGGRAVNGYDFVDNDATAQDGNGHGTHVAGTLGGATYGVAKGVKLVAVRVLNNQGSGTVSGVVAGIDWVTADHKPGQPAVANMSLGGGISSALDNAVSRSIADGVTYCVAGGNEGANVLNGSPARVAAAITVGAVDSGDVRPSWSNYGFGVDVFAPGVSIPSAWRTSDTAVASLSGTSMATPHVAGVAALYLAANPSATPSQVQSTIISMAVAGKVTNAGAGSPNRLLNKGTL